MTDSDTTTVRRWRRTSFRRLDGSVEFAPDDWCLEDGAGQPLARIYRQTGGPRGGRWLWFVQFDAAGRPWNGGMGALQPPAIWRWQAVVAHAERTGMTSKAVT